MSEVVSLPAPEERQQAFCRTPTAAGILGMLGYCQREGEMGLLIGAPGTGKTTALQQYTAAGRRVWYADMTPASARLAGSLARILHAFGTAGVVDRAYVMSRQICHKLNEEGAGGLLIVDEAQFLLDESLEQLRRIHDETGVGLVFAGNMTFVSRFSRKAAVAAFAQFTSRIGARLVLKEPMPEDIGALCDHHRIAGKQARLLLERHAALGGGLRIVGKLIRHAERVSENRAIELRHLHRAEAALGVGE